jgi:hypothetical protein
LREPQDGEIFQDGEEDNASIWKELNHLKGVVDQLWANVEVLPNLLRCLLSPLPNGDSGDKLKSESPPKPELAPLANEFLVVHNRLQILVDFIQTLRARLELEPVEVPEEAYQYSSTDCATKAEAAQGQIRQQIAHLLLLLEELRLQIRLLDVCLSPVLSEETKSNRPRCVSSSTSEGTNLDVGSKCPLAIEIMDIASDVERLVYVLQGIMSRIRC